MSATEAEDLISHLCGALAPADREAFHRAARTTAYPSIVAVLVGCRLRKEWAIDDQSATTAKNSCLFYPMLFPGKIKVALAAAPRQ